MKKVFLLALASIAFTACKKEADFSKIEKGMKLADVVNIVGEPKEVKEIPVISTKFYMYDKNVVVFVDDVVTRCETSTQMAKGMEDAGLDDLDNDIEKIDAAVQEYKDSKPAN